MGRGRRGAAADAEAAAEAAREQALEAREEVEALRSVPVVAARRGGLRVRVPGLDVAKGLDGALLSRSGVNIQ